MGVTIAQETPAKTWAALDDDKRGVRVSVILRLVVPQLPQCSFVVWQQAVSIRCFWVNWFSTVSDQAHSFEPDSPLISCQSWTQALVDGGFIKSTLVLGYILVPDRLLHLFWSQRGAYMCSPASPRWQSLKLIA